MKVDLFDFDLPRRFIAAYPASPRDSARMLDLTGDSPVDRGVRDFPGLIKADDIIVANNTRVIPARLRGRRGGAAVEITIHKQKSNAGWLAFAKPARKLHEGDRIQFADDFHAAVVEKRSGGEVFLMFNQSGPDFMACLNRYGSVPLPPYIKREGSSLDDRENYQTIFATHEGAVAAPTAGLHFTETLLRELDQAGAGLVTLTLHVGAGTFLPVKASDTADHRMHTEWGFISEETVDSIRRAKAAGGRIIALGTTSLRLLETAADETGNLNSFSGETDIFITPGYSFKAVDLLLTNFHLPRSTLFMLVSAFAGLKKMHSAYEYAKQMNYRFFSYGDCCLLKRKIRST